MQKPSVLKLVDWICQFSRESKIFWAISGRSSELHHKLYPSVNLGPGSPISARQYALHRQNSGGLVKLSAVHLWWSQLVIQRSPVKHYNASCCLSWLAWEHVRQLGLPLGPQVTTWPSSSLSHWRKSPKQLYVGRFMHLLGTRLWWSAWDKFSRTQELAFWRKPIYSKGKIKKCHSFSSLGLDTWNRIIEKSTD